MTPTIQRDHVYTLAKNAPKQALIQARKISDPWFRAQALSWVARFTDGDVVAIASEAAQAAAECDDNYKKSAVRAWEIAALAERGYKEEANKRLGEVLKLSLWVEPASSRSEALLLLLQAAFVIGHEQAEIVYANLKASCPISEHWRCKRTIRNGEKMLAGKLKPRIFFW